jgi:ABC-type multidrug transport system fused ATPase/permease subunit
MNKAIKQYAQLLSAYLRPQWKRVLILSIIVFMSISLSLLNPQVLKAFIDTATSGGTLETLLGVGVLYMGIAIFSQLATVTETYLAENIGLTATNQMRNDLTAHCLSLDPTFHNAHTPGEMIERVDGDVATLGNFFSRFVVQLCSNGLLLIGVLVMFFLVDWRVGGVMTLFAIIAFLMLSRISRLAGPRWAATRQNSAELFGFVEERLSGTEDIRANGAIAYVMRLLVKHSRKLLRSTVIASILGSLSWTTSLFLFSIGTAVSLMLGLLLYTSGAISIGTVFLLYSYNDLLQKPIENISRQIQDLQLATAGITRIRELLNTRSAVVEKPSARLDHPPFGVEFERVVFGYEGEAPVVRELSFHIQPGERLGLLGRTGSGKTTLTRLLFRLYDPLQGSIRLNGIDLRDLAITDLRQNIAIVTQDIQLFNASVRDNLTFFDHEISDARIMQVLDELELLDWLNRLPHGLDSKLEPGGKGISAGEAQLLAFARVYMKDPGLVILDEASSRLDPATDHHLQRAVDRLLAGRTGIIIAHRLATVQTVDSILILDEGCCCETGPREALARNPQSRFAQLLHTGLEEALA